MHLYGQYQSLENVVAAEYRGFFTEAIPADESAYDLYGKLLGKEYTYIMFYLLACVLPFLVIAVFAAAYLSSRVTLKRTFANSRWYASFSALIAIGVCFSLFVVAMDTCALVWAFKDNKYNEWQEIKDSEDVVAFDFVIVAFILDTLFVAVGFTLIFVSFLLWLRKDERKPVKLKDQTRCMKLLYFSFIGPLGCLGTHASYMFTGWLTDPLHGGAVLVVYAVSFVSHYVVGKLVYQFFEDRGLKAKNDDYDEHERIAKEGHDSLYDTMYKRNFSFLSLMIVIGCQLVFALCEVFAIAAFAALPLAGLAEKVPMYLLSLFEIAVLFASVVLSYKYLTADAPIEREVVLGAIDNMKYMMYLRQLEHAELPEEGEERETEERRRKEEGRKRQPRTDTDAQRTAAVVGAIGHNYLFGHLPADPPTLHFLRENVDEQYEPRRSARQLIQAKLGRLRRRGQQHRVLREGDSESQNEYIV